jgi:hypothetical protein
VLDAWLAEQQSGAGAPVLLVEDGGDLAVGMVLGEPADQLDGVLGRAGALGPAPREPELQLGARAAFPLDLDLRPPGLLADRDGDLVEQRAQELLAVARRRGRCLPQPRQVTSNPREGVALGGGERLRSAALELGELAALALEILRRGLEPGLQRAGDEPVLGLAGVKLAPRPPGFELRALDREALADESLVVLALELLDRLRGRSDPGGRDGLEKRGRDRPLQAGAPTDWHE